MLHSMLMVIHIFAHIVSHVGTPVLLVITAAALLTLVIPHVTTLATQVTTWDSQIIPMDVYQLFVYTNLLSTDFSCVSQVNPMNVYLKIVNQLFSSYFQPLSTGNQI